MELVDFDFNLPEELIAQEPAARRDSARLLLCARGASAFQHSTVRSLHSYLHPGDLLVLNNTKVIPARLFAQRGDRAFELLLLEPSEEEALQRWKCLVRPGRRIKGITELQAQDGTQLFVERSGDDFTVRFDLGDQDFWTWLSQNGEPPIPPYVRRKADVRDRERYQTVYAKTPGSVAAPTAGLHFTKPLLEDLQNRGIEMAEVTLRVGYGTFAPVTPDQWKTQTLHEELYEIPDATSQKIKAARRVIALGTTTLRALESGALWGPRGKTRLFIQPGFSFKVVDALFTNFHLPQSSLFVLVSAFMGKSEARAAYEEAIRAKYRFYSYGDAMFIS